MRLSLADSYRTLQITRDATDLEVTTSYRRLSLAHHPDRNYGDASATERFQRISAAHQAITSHRQDQKAGTINGSQGRSGATSRGSWYHSGRPSQGHHDGSDDSENEDDNDIDSFFDDEDLYFSPDFGNLSVFEYFMFMFEQIHREAAAGTLNEVFGLRTWPQGPVSPQQTKPRTHQLYLEPEAVHEREQRQKEEARAKKEARELERQREMAEGAIRREAKARARRLEKAEAAKAAAARAHERALQTQRNRSATFVAARRGDWQAVKAGVYEDNVSPVGGEWLETTTDQIKEELLEAARISKQAEQERNSMLQEAEAGRNNHAEKREADKGDRGGRGLGRGRGRGRGRSRGKRKQKCDGRNIPSERPIVAPTSSDPKETLLHIACKSDDLDLVKWLCAHGAMTDERDSAGYLPIHRAFQIGSMPLIGFFFLGEQDSPVFPGHPHAAALWPERFPSSALPCPPEESIISLAAYSGDWATVELAMSYIEPDPTAVNEVAEVWAWIDAMLEAGRGRPGQAERKAWEEVKWALAAFEGFQAPEPYGRPPQTVHRG